MSKKNWYNYSRLLNASNKDHFLIYYNNNVSLLSDLYTKNKYNKEDFVKEYNNFFSIDINSSNNKKKNIDLYSDHMVEWINTNISSETGGSYKYELLSKIDINIFYEKNVNVKIKQMKNINDNLIKIVIFFQILMNEISSFLSYFVIENNGIHILFFNDIISYINNNINNITDEKLNIFEVFLIKKVFAEGIRNIYGGIIQNNIVKNSWFFLIIDILLKMIINYNTIILIEDYHNY